MNRWRTGREDPRAVFRDGECVGRLNDIATSGAVVRAMNDETALRAKIKAYADLLAAGTAPYTDGPTDRGVAAALRLIMVGVYDPTL